MRIISGTARGRKLAEFKGSSIRPTSDRVREAVFSMLNSRLGSMNGCCVLDLFAGTGAMGLEALSRGAKLTVFMDQSKDSINLIRKNATTTRLIERAEIIQSDISQGIGRQSRQFDLIYMDPPYHNQEIAGLIQLLAEKALLKQGGILCVETDSATPLPEMIAPLVQIDRKKYGSTSVSIYRHGDSTI